MKRVRHLIAAVGLVVGGINASGEQLYRSPIDLAFDSTSSKLYIAEQTGKVITILDAETNKVTGTVKLGYEPTGIVIHKDKIYAVGNSPIGTVSIIDRNSAKVVRTIDAGHYLIGPQVSNDGSTLYVCDRFTTKILFIDIASGKVTGSTDMTREPIDSVLTKNGKFLFVANHLPKGAANVDFMTSVIDVVDVNTKAVVKSIVLPNGAIDLRTMCLSPDGKRIYVPSIFARFLVPTTQIERGWINTHAMNIIDVDQQKITYTVLLDNVEKGAANPWGITVTEDSKYICVAHSATHEISLIDVAKMNKKLKKYPENNASTVEEKIAYESRADNPANDLGFINDFRVRIQLPGNGPRAIVSKGNKIYTGMYFTDNLNMVEIKDSGDHAVSEISLGATRPQDVVRKGEMYFNDASLCFQNWQACSTCHPDSRSDAVNWDLLNDGIGNPKSTKSMLLSHATPPAMISGIRAKAEVAVRAGIKFIQFAVVDRDRPAAIDEYLKSLKPLPSPFLINGKDLSESAKRGKAVFAEANCGACHSGPYWTDQQKYKVGTSDGLDKDMSFDVPMLTEVWRTAPYLNDGRAATMKDVFTTFNKNDKHGKTSHLTDQQIEDLCTFVNSL